MARCALINLERDAIVLTRYVKKRVGTLLQIFIIHHYMFHRLRTFDLIDTSEDYRTRWFSRDHSTHKNILSAYDNHVCISEEVRDSFEIRTDVGQGCIFSIIAFTYVIDWIRDIACRYSRGVQIQSTIPQILNTAIILSFLLTIVTKCK